MAVQPWFKMYAGDYLLDPGVDAIPREAEGLLVRMWCVCHIEGSCPDDPEELARKTRCNPQYVLQCKPHCQSLFELRDGRLYSKRMEDEKRRSEQASKNASQRYKQKSCAIGSANRSATGRQLALPRSDSDYDSKKGSGSTKASASQELTYEPDLEGNFDVLVEQIAREYPGNEQRGEAIVLPPVVANAICEAITRDGRDVVLRGTQTFAAAVKKWPKAQRLRFIPAAHNFFQRGDYTYSQEYWEQRATVEANTSNSSEAYEKRAPGDLPVNVTLNRENRRAANGD